MMLRRRCDVCSHQSWVSHDFPRVSESRVSASKNIHQSKLRVTNESCGTPHDSTTPRKLFVGLERESRHKYHVRLAETRIQNRFTIQLQDHQDTIHLKTQRQDKSNSLLLSIHQLHHQPFESTMFRLVCIIAFILGVLGRYLDDHYEAKIDFKSSSKHQC